MTVDIRYRAMRGKPRSRTEALLQILWRWRIEIALAYILAGVAASVILELLVLRR